MLRLLVIYSLLAWPAPDQVAVYLGTDPTASIRLPAGELGAPDDLAWDAQGRTLTALTTLAGRSYAARWSASGELLGKWRLPDGYKAEGALHVYQRRLRAILWRPPEDHLELLTLPDQAGGAPVRERLPKWADYDAALAPDRVPAVRRSMRVLGIEGPPPGPHAFPNPDGGVERFFMNARQLRESQISWSPDASVWSFGGRFQSPAVAVRQRHGHFRIADVGPAVNRALALNRGKPEAVAVEAITLSARRAAFGLRLEEGIFDDEDFRARHAVTWFDLEQFPPRILRTRPGFLARDLEQF